MKAAAMILPLLLIICCPRRQLAQTSPQQATQGAAAMSRWLSTERRLAAEGHARAEETLGEFYYFGVSVPRDYTKAAYWFQKAAEQDDVGAQFEIGNLYFQGQGVPQSYRQAYFWLDLAAARASEQNLLKQMPVAEMRDQAASHLTRTELSDIQQRAERWFESHKPKAGAPDLK